MIGAMTRTMEDLDHELDLEVADRGRGPVGTVARVATAPFRLVAGVVMFLAKVVGAVFGIVALPFVLAGVVIRKLVALLADLVYGIWRVITWIVALVAGVLLFVLKVLDATVGNVIRLVYKLVFGTLKFVLKVITFGAIGRKAVDVVTDDDDDDDD